MRRGRPSAFDLRVAGLRGRGVRAAAFFTWLGRTYPILAVALLAAAGTVATGRSPEPVVVLLASQTLSQGAVSVLKRAFGRRRPDQWLLRAEAGLSFPSGHSSTAIVFYAALGAMALGDTSLPHAAAVAGAIAAAICAVGLPWSRLVLGAHYASDVAGGLIFGAAWTLASLAALG